MARKIKIGLSNSLQDTPASTTIYIDNVAMETFNVNEPQSAPKVLEYPVNTSNSTIDLKITLNNDYYASETSDLNLYVNYVALSDENGVYTPYTYVVKSTEGVDLRTLDNSALYTETLWTIGDEFNMTIDLNSPTTWFDNYQHDLDNPPPPENP